MDDSKFGCSSKFANKNDNEESLSHFRYDLTKLFNLRDFVKDREDLWLFVKKYEAVQKKAKSVKKIIDREKFNERLMENTILTNKEKNTLQMASTKNTYGIKYEMVAEFKTILLSYIDFKQKENTSTAKKIKEMQESLPVYQFREEIVEAVSKHAVTIIAGDTGCGKSTQVPQYLLNAGFQRIGCTQPRRIACISLAKRVSYETMNKFGEEVGYQIRFEKNARKETKIIFITEGLLLRQVVRDSLLSEYDIIVLDEIHERHLQGDFLLGLLKCILVQRPSLKVVLMSATINLPLFSSFFAGQAATIQVPGRLHPIQVDYLPAGPLELKPDRFDPAPYVRIMQLIDNKYPSCERGDLLMFVSGTSAIDSVLEAARCYNEKVNKWVLLPLHSSLSLAEQDKVFAYPPEGIRKCVVATNIAETSITVDGVRFVADSGLAKLMSYDPLARVQLLKECWVSKASAEQRKGRAGRTGPGVCFRLYSEQDYEAMTDFTLPEIQRVPLDSLLLQLSSLGLSDVRKFPFLEPPPSDNIENTILALKHHGAVSEEEKLTDFGEVIASLPVEVALGKMLIAGSMFHQVEAALSLAAGLSVQSPLMDRIPILQVQVLREELESDQGDPISLLRMFVAWLAVKGERGASRAWCRARRLEEQRFYEMSKLRRQFRSLLQDCQLLKEQSNVEESRSERALRKGEVRHLKRLRAEAAEGETSKKRKVLRVRSFATEEDGEGERADSRDIDFRLMNNLTQLEGLIDGSRVTSHRDLTILKVILCSGLYPQYALPDSFNMAKGVSEQLFHTKERGFVFLHPLSCFARHPEVLHCPDSDGSLKHPLSSSHQILFYMSLLETNKPYLVNAVRMPAAQSLLLLSRQLHTNSDISRIICDSWVELSFPVGFIGEKLLLKVIRLRSIWQQLLLLRMQGGDGRRLERDLEEGVVGLMSCQPSYRLKRLLPADLRTAYTAISTSIPTLNPFDPDWTITPHHLGGVSVTSYVVYDCLTGDVSLAPWTCPHCDLAAPLSSLQRLHHLHQAHPNTSYGEEDRTSEEGSGGDLVRLECPDCQKQLWLTRIQVLKHRRSHLSGPHT